ncbi:GerMN domain-containing protein [Peptoniphilus sp. oral taxon 386]|uniref:GerMN domain-containing protein n=1 Tax=Peptoniphilus sp. oral taxon 386 TaxID=652713 RepID=UPI0001DA9D04|nr:GerMN domain-containing protein [Peptoniphilus sp. oral taxon 386]EFI42476.1 hypothetical protein HMPREF0629_01128 [Peptoniphilus sp. oral taxon 386 str. F0131]
MKKFTQNLIFIAIILLLLTSCGKSSINNSASEKEPVNETVYEISLYYPTKEFVVNGDENYKFASIRTTVNDIDEIKDELEKLKVSPKTATNSDGKETDVFAAIPKKITINNIELHESIFTVDLNSKNLEGGSLDEQILIGSIVNTLKSVKENNTPVSNSVKFTVDGKDVQTLMGHFDVTEPIEE